MDLTRLQSLLDRIGAYPPLEIAVELLLIALVVWSVVRFVQGTRAAGALKGLLLVFIVATLVVRVVGGGDSFLRLGYLYDRFLALAAIALIVIFQPELRRALIRLGETSILGSGGRESTGIAETLASSCTYLAKQRFGAIIVIERRFGLRGLTEGGTVLDAELTERLLNTIFYPGSALHDLAVVIRAGRVHAAGVQLPLAEPDELPEAGGTLSLGSRHRAAIGISKESDALVLIVSEESGHTRISERGRLSKPIDPERLAAEIRSRLEKASAQTPGAPASKERPASDVDDPVTDPLLEELSSEVDPERERV